MLVFPQLLEFRQMLAHSRKRNPFTIPAIISHAQGKEVISHNPTDIQVVMQTFQGFIMKKFIFCVSHFAISISLFNPVQVGRQTHHPAVTLELSA